MKVKEIIKQFIAANAKAYASASVVFKDIEAKSDTWIDELAKAGIVGADIRVFAVAYVAEQSDVEPHKSKQGGALTFTKDTTEYNRVKYLVDTATGAAAERAAKRKAKQSHGKADPVAKLLEAYAALSPAQKRSFKAQL